MPITEPTKNQRNPFQYLRPVEPADFVGRRQQCRQIAVDLTLDNGDSHAIIAGRRCGKSSLLLAIGDQLREQPAQQGEGDWLALPLYFDFKAAAFPSVEAFYRRILDELCRRVDRNARRRPPDRWNPPILLEVAWFAELTTQSELSLRDFEDAVGYVLDKITEQVGPQVAGVRLVLLLDEIDETLDLSWNSDLFNQLRSLVYSGDLRTQVRIVVAGSRRFLDQVSDRGSPLWNILKLHYLMVFDRAGFAELTAKWPGLSVSLADAVGEQSGGHPFLAQYLYHHLWLSQQSASVDEERIIQLVHKFYAEQAQDLDGWRNGIEATGLTVYGALADSDEWLTEEAIGAALNQPAHLTKRGLTALCYHGLIIHENWERYRRAGQLFRTWFNQYTRGVVTTNAITTSNNPEPSGQQITYNINTGGGSYVSGNVATEGGNFAGRDQQARERKEHD